MPGAWELQQHARVLVGILHTDTVTLAWSLGLRNMQGIAAILPVAGQPYDMGRNTINRAALEGGFTHAFHFDSDVVAPPDAIPRLLSRRVDICSGIYHRRSPPVGVPVLIKNGQWVQNYPPNSLFEVDYVGAGCLLLSRNVMERMARECPPKPNKQWFSWQVDEVGLCPPGWNLSEDFVFCKQAKDRLGIPTLVDSNVICKHIGYSEVHHNRMDALHCVA